MCPKHVYRGKHRTKIYFTIIPFFLALFPDEPTKLTVTNIKSRTAEISWINPNNTGDGDLTGFWIKLKKENSLILNTTTDKVNEYELDNLTPYTTYKISVAVGNKHGFGEETITSFLTSEEGENEILSMLWGARRNLDYIITTVKHAI
jgi:hypothetical protein